MKIAKSVLPMRSLLNTTTKKFHYVDSFAGVLNDQNDHITTTDLGKAFFSTVPKWIEWLMVIRNRIVSVFGLKTPGKKELEEQLDNFKCEVGEQIGLFKVFEKTSDEVVLGEDDKHLNFRVSIFKEPLQQNKQQLTITTAVVFNNWLGRFYFVPVRPFHKLIVPTLLQGMIKKLENRK